MSNLATEPPLTDQKAYFYDEPMPDEDVDRIAAAASDLAEQIKALKFPAHKVKSLLFWLDDFEREVEQGLRPEGEER